MHLEFIFLAGNLLRVSNECVNTHRLTVLFAIFTDSSRLIGHFLITYDSVYGVFLT